MTRHEHIKSIIQSVAARHGVAEAEIMGRTRLSGIVAARAEAMFRIKQELGLSFPHIGRIFGRDSSSAVHLFWRVRRALGDSSIESMDAEDASFIIAEAFQFGRGEKEPIEERRSEDPFARNVTPVEYCAELRRAAKINSIWRRRGVEANARVILQDGAPVVVSSLQLVRRA